MHKRHIDWRLGLVVILAITVFMTAVFTLQHWRDRAQERSQAPAARSAAP